MKFEKVLYPENGMMLAMAGATCKEALDAGTAALMREAGGRVTQAAAARWAWRGFGLEWAQDGPTLAEAGLTLPGRSIAAHLQHCHRCMVLGVTLGPGVDEALRRAQTEDMALTALMDAAASQLVEQYADVAEDVIKKSEAFEGIFSTGRFSPGYGDLSLGLQRSLLTALNAQREMGLTVTAGGMLTPMKSVTALVGVARQPVTGHLAGCEECSLAQDCQTKKEGRTCGKRTV